MTPHDYEYLRKLLKARSGLVLTAEKHYLVESRLLPLARRFGLFNLTGLVAKLKGPDAEALIVEVVEAMTTNESFFYRDKVPFDHFRETVMPALMAARGNSRRIRIWCAAASSGPRALFAGAVPEGDGQGVARLADRDRCHRSVDRSPGEGQEPASIGNSRCSAVCRCRC